MPKSNARKDTAHGTGMTGTSPRRSSEALRPTHRAPRRLRHIRTTGAAPHPSPAPAYFINDTTPVTSVRYPTRPNYAGYDTRHQKLLPVSPNTTSTSPATARPLLPLSKTARASPVTVQGLAAANAEIPRSRISSHGQDGAGGAGCGCAKGLVDGWLFAEELCRFWG